LSARTAAMRCGGSLGCGDDDGWGG
jgi:hypothetical protein